MGAAKGDGRMGAARSVGRVRREKVCRRRGRVFPLARFVNVFFLFSFFSSFLSSSTTSCQHRTKPGLVRSILPEELFNQANK